MPGAEMADKSFAEKYGPWALVAGGSEGLGGAWSDALAARGLNVVVVSHEADSLSAKTQELTQNYGVEVLPVHADLASDNILAELQEVTDEREVGFLVYNAGLADLGTFASQPIEKELYRLNLNCRGPLLLSHHYGALMLQRRRGGIVLMTSLAALMGNPYNVGYAASKAYDAILAEGLWYEYGREGVDVMSCMAGLIKTHNDITDDMKSGGGKPMTAEAVVEEALSQLGSTPTMVPGRHNRFTHWLMTRILPREKVIKSMARTYRKHWPSLISGD